ncbi:glycosyl hydrolase [Streptomyces sp. NPDC049577]|uniref:glycoside hydrolase family 26 protein n=1 Tax=Streptomyces sp. NPDC049577 TaxID=3155153 RepID=UPI0034163EF7
MRSRLARAAVAVLLVGAMAIGLSGCAELISGGEATGRSVDLPPPSEDIIRPFDIQPLVQPRRKFFGAALEDAPSSMAGADKYAELVGKRPDLLEYYAAWGDDYNTAGVHKAWKTGAMTVVSWEPDDTTIADIADGKSDAYVKRYAESVRNLNLPIVMSFADEMNGHWEKWGTKYVKAADYVRAWKHVHDVFVDAGAVNVIWAWSPNIINPVKKIDIHDYYPGDDYVDWVGMVGYFTHDQPYTFDAVFGPTIAKVRTFTRKPLLVLETAADTDPKRRSAIVSLFKGIKARKDVVGFIWFDYSKRADWRLVADTPALAEFKRLAADDTFGFDVRKP